METETLKRINKRYLLLTFLPYYEDKEGRLWLDSLWCRDFEEHLRYLSRPILAAPKIAKEDLSLEDQKNLQLVKIPPGVDLQLQHVDPPAKLIKEIVTSFKWMFVLWKLVGRADIVHFTLAGWPFLRAWFLLLCALLRKKSRVVVVESAEWRNPSPSGEGFLGAIKRKIISVLVEIGAKLAVRSAHLSIYTHQGYRNSLLGDGKGQSAVLPVSWIREEDILTDEMAGQSWEEKRLKQGEQLRLLIAGRLTESKGVGVLLQALELLDQKGVRVKLDVYGYGPFRDQLESKAGSFKSVQIVTPPPIPYGRAMLDVIRKQHVVVAPSLSDEQPRILFDAFSQAVPVIASDTEGLKSILNSHDIGWIIPKGDAKALAEKIRTLTENHEEICRKGINALLAARNMTHHKMHSKRWRLLLERFGSK